jgi:hypothetical protein
MSFAGFESGVQKPTIPLLTPLSDPQE